MLKLAQALGGPFRTLAMTLGDSGSVLESPIEPREDELRERELGLLEGKDHLFRLFVGWVPKLFTEADLQPLFEQCGNVKDLIILKDKVTGAPRGCAFVRYGTKEEAENAIARLDRQVHLPGALSPLEVRFARSHQYIQAGAGPNDNRQLFFARAPALAGEEDMQRLFARYGDVEEVNLFRERRTHLSQGCGFVTMGGREQSHLNSTPASCARAQAIAAMEALDEQLVMDGQAAPLAVKWADPDLQVKKRRAVEDSNAENRMLFFAKVLRSATEDEVRALFANYGRVYDVNLFRAFQGAPTTKGCGLVTMGSNEEACAAIEALDSQFVWDGMVSPMVVKWMDAALQKRRREEHLAAMRQGLVPSMAMDANTRARLNAAAPDAWLSSRTALQNPSPALASLNPGALNPSMGASSLALPRMVPVGPNGKPLSISGEAHVQEAPPAGCAPDAYKLFVGNIPKNYTEDELRPFFESVGSVIELVIVRDKFTHESKGSAFVWYQTRAMADRAVLQYNVRHVLPDPTGEQDRPLVVRRANTRKAAGGAAAAAVAAAQQQQGLMGGGMGLTNNMLDLMGAPPGMLMMGAGAGEVPIHVQPMMASQMHAAQAAAKSYGTSYSKGPSGNGLSLGLEGLSLGNSNGDVGHSSSSNAVLDPYGMPSSSQFGGARDGPGSFMGRDVSNQFNSRDSNVAFGRDGSELNGLSPSRMGGMHAPAMPSNVHSNVHSSGENALVSGGDNAYAMLRNNSAPGSGGGGGSNNVTLSMTLTASQMTAVTNHIYSIQTMAGADVSSQAVAPGLFCLVLSGSQPQVDSAKNLVAAVLAQVNMVFA